MPELRCTVQTCVHNMDFNCELNQIQVGGNAAKNPEETCCGSFARRDETGDSYRNVVGQASPLSNIDCEAVDCKYNDHCKCHAGKISVEGGNACQSAETECATFVC